MENNLEEMLLPPEILLISSPQMDFNYYFPLILSEGTSVSLSEVWHKEM